MTRKTSEMPMAPDESCVSVLVVSKGALQQRSLPWFAMKQALAKHPNLAEQLKGLGYTEPGAFAGVSTWLFESARLDESTDAHTRLNEPALSLLERADEASALFQTTE